jgi:hypothetical protein
MSYREKAIGGLIFGLFAATPMIAAQISVPNTFQAGETASADAVNENFTVLAGELSDLQQKLDDLEAHALFDHEDFIDDLSEFLEVYYSSPGDTAVEGPIVRVAGANLQIVNAARSNVPDGTGNLIVGMSLARADGDEICSDASHDNENDCLNAGEVWGQAHNSGSHNIVGGVGSAYSATGGIVFGSSSAINANRATVISGFRNIASGAASVAIGGNDSTATGIQAAVLGGSHNVASGNRAVITGGQHNEAAAFRSTVTGGQNNTTHGNWSSISGGDGCTLTGDHNWGAGNTGGC